MSRPIVEWQVVLEERPIEVHIFRTEAAARKFADASPTPDILEGGIVYPKPPIVRKVVYHQDTRARRRWAHE